MRPLKKSLLLIVIALMVALPMLISGGYLWINSKLGRDWLQARINTGIPGSITIGTQRLRILTLGVDLDDVTLRDPQGHALAGFTHLAVRLAWHPLLQRELRVQSLLLQTPWAKLVQDPETGLSLIRALVQPDEKIAATEENDQGALPFNITCQSLKLTDGCLVFDAPGDDVHLTAEGMTLSASGDLMHRQALLDLQVQRLETTGTGIHPQPTRIRLNARLDGDRLEIPILQFAIGQTTLDLQAAIDQLVADPVVNGQVRLQSEFAELKDVLNLDGPYAGRLTGRLDLNGRLSDPAAHLVLALDTGQVAGHPLDRAEFAVVLKDRLATIGPAAWQLAGGAVRLDGTVDLRNAFPAGFLTSAPDVDAIAYNLSLTQTAPDLNPWMALASTIQGQLESRLTLAGSGVRPEACSARLTLNARGQNLLTTGMDQPIDASVDLEAQLDEGKLTLTRLDATSDDVSITGNARFEMDNQAIAGELRVQAWNLSRPLAVVGQPSVRGAGNAAITVGGDLHQPQFSIDLAATGLNVDGYPLGDLAIDAKMAADGILNLRRLDVKNRASRIWGSGRTRLIPGAGRIDPEFDNRLELTIDKAAISDFMPDPPLDGQWDARLKVSGPLKSLKAALRLDGTGIDIAGQPIESVNLDARFENQRIWLNRLAATLAPGETMVADGSVGLDKSLDLRLMTDGIALKSIQALQGRLPAQGLLRLGLRARGSLDDPDIDGQLTASAIRINEEPMADIDLSVSLNDHEARVKGHLNFGVDAVYDLQHGDFKGALIFDKTETAAYFRAFGRPEASGTLTGRIEASGNIHAIDEADTLAELSDLQLFFNNTPLIQSDRLALKLAGRQLTIPESELSLLSTGRLRVKGDARMDGDLDLSIAGRIPIAAIAVIREDLADATGQLVLDGRIEGSVTQPRIDARVELDRIAMTIPGLDQRLHDLGGRILIGTNTVRFEDVSGFLDTGTFRLTGRITHDSFTPTNLDLTLAARALPVAVPDTLSVLLNSDIRITGSNRQATAQGEIVLVEGSYYKDVKINLLQMAVTRQRSVSPASRPIQVPYFDKVNLDIGVSHRQPFQVENNLADLEISPDLTIGGTLALPIVSGRAEVTSGTVNFQRRTFTVNKGVIDFVNPYKTDAEIDIESETTIRDWTITLALQGTPDNLKLELSSVPSETNSDILSLILFGRTASELTAGEGGNQRSSSQIMAEMLADTFGEDIKKATGVDILEVETDSSEDDDAADVKVTVGKHLSNRITVKYAVESSDGELLQRAITEYKLLENILVSGFQDSKGVYGTELSFRIEFR
ncbi:translocation/assembly module TamB [Desulfosarcina ovata]|uniref:Translocation and assembly module TamB C-terminal domain-containing protein n=1 Tax=Desulfosarcina ovata subsp. ovata TaxID=2752305 RepID=A0A5K8AEX9_9BACT|nr:translocation/assembly module TamB [Desulfosarcina ovata]BBO91038.1 hypothetical protein DSCOOX_42180 [Desulfosarcina ovata subsp. ovata]